MRPDAIGLQGVIRRPPARLPRHAPAHECAQGAILPLQPLALGQGRLEFTPREIAASKSSLEQDTASGRDIPRRARLPGAAAMELGKHDLPDVVLEIDHTTDVRRGKLLLFEAWGFPEVWVEVPEGYSASRPGGGVRG